LSPTPSLAQTIYQNGYNPNHIMEDNDLLNVNSMSLQDIQSFLQNKGSFLSSYTTANTYGDLKTAAEIIYDATHRNYDCTGATLSDSPTEAERMVKCRQITTISPQFLLVLLQKENSLIQNSAPTQNALDTATGYGCPTGQGCNPYWKGFGKQVNSAALQFLAYMKEPGKYGFKNGGTYIAKDKYSMLKTPAKAISDGDYNSIVASPNFTSITIENQATAAMYNYTPHVYNGNYNAYKLMNDYFPKNNSGNFPPVIINRSFPNGSILKSADKPEIWLIENGQKRHFANWSAFASRFRPEQIVTATATEINNYASGDEIKFANYSLVKTPDNKMYLLVDKEKRPFGSLAIYKKIGFNPEELESATEADLASYKLGKTITATSTYITGALLKDSKTNEIFYVENGTKAAVDKVLLETKYAGQKIIPKTTKELKALAVASPILLDDGILVKTSSYPTIYLISDGKKRPFASDLVFQNLGYNAQNVITVSSQFLYNYAAGAIIN
jgi:hypothetical protein